MKLPNKVQIITLKDDHDNVVTTKEGLEMYVRSFYGKLLYKTNVDVPR